MSFGGKTFWDKALYVSLLIFCITIIWLWFTNQLVLFISAQYVIFAGVTATIGLVALISYPFVQDRSHAHETQDKPSKTLTVTTLVAVMLLLIIAPSSLSTAFSKTKPINAGSSALSAGAVQEDQWKSFTVKEWASITSNGSSFNFEDKKVNLKGYVTYLDENNFYLSRLVVRCCAIDAQPVGVKVHADSWQEKYSEGEWLQVKGKFQTKETGPSTLEPEKITSILEPEQPYVS